LRHVVRLRNVFLFSVCLAAVGHADAALMEYFKGRYGAIELFDSAKKLSFRVNAPELSQPRDFCQFNDLSTAIAAIDAGLLPDFNAPVDDLTLVPSGIIKTRKNLTLKQALRAGTPEVFAALRAKLSAAQVLNLNAKSALPTKIGKTSAFALLDWFKALHANSLALKPATTQALRTLLTQKRNGSSTLLAFSSRCAGTTGAALGASIGIVQRDAAAPVYFAVSVDGKSRADLFNVAPKIRDAALHEFGYWRIDAEPDSHLSATPKALAK
jgi:beta-lactamase class D